METTLQDEIYLLKRQFQTFTEKLELIEGQLKNNNTCKINTCKSFSHAILDQSDFYNGHGQMIVGEMTIKEIRFLLEDLSRDIVDTNLENKCCNIFYLALFNEEKGWSGTIYQAGGLDNGQDKIWLGIENVIID